jgi:REP element-mobilizing transposase RayT
MDKFRGKYRIPSTRLQKWDYAWNASYFVTICTSKRKHYFGEIIDGEMRLSGIGELACKYWHEIPEHFPFVILDSFQAMPNHIHGILIIAKPANGLADGSADRSATIETRHCLVSAEYHEYPNHPDTIPTKLTPGQIRYQNQGKDTLSSILGSYKSVVTKYAHKINPRLGWQARFHDHIIRDHASYQRIRNYIMNNPENWKEDIFFE